MERLPQEGVSTAAARGNYAASVASSRPGNSLHRALTKLQRAISAMTQSDAELKGERQISMESKNLTECAQKLAERAETEPDLDDHLLDVMEDLLEQSKKLEKYASIRLDQLARHKKRRKI